MGETVESYPEFRLGDGNLELNLRRDPENCPGSSGSSGASVLPNGCNGVDENSVEAKEKKGSFQITRVVSRSGEGGDGAWLDDPGSDLGAANSVDAENTVFCSTKDAADRLRRAKDSQSRFRLVKIESEEGVRHGRWHCLDFSDCAASGGTLELSRSMSMLESLFGAGGTYNEVKTPAVCELPTSNAGHFVGNVAFEVTGQGDLDCGSEMFDDPLTVNWISHPPGSMPVDPVSPSAAFLSSTFDTVAEKEHFRTLPSFDSEFLGSVDFASSLQFFQENLFTSRAQKPPDTNGEGLDDGGASAVAIDNKIEQAMDLVKSHLMFAVREEVEQLKVKIQELSDRNARLEYENMVLRESAPQETIAKLQHSPPLLPS